MADQTTAHKKCHNCRRQRLRCDLSYPHCNKCILAGKECLGYGQLFRWTGAVASRGKLAGKTSSAPLIAGSNPNQLEYRDDTSMRSSSEEAPILYDFQVVQEPENTYHMLSTPWVLVDPLYQDLSHPYRHYLSYFTNRVCKDLVAHDLPDRNPFRTLVPLTSANPLLQHIIVAASAAHMSNLVRPSPRLNKADGQLIYPSSGEASKRALTDALVAKHKALQLMHIAVQNVDSVGVDVVLAAALFFINVELIESGKHGWKAHMEGARKLMSLQPLETSNADLRDYLLSDTLSYFILASAFMPATSAQSYFDAAQIPMILERAAANSYLCCPPESLEILYAASQLANVEIVDDESAARVATAGAELLKNAQDLDIRAWAVDALNIDYLHEIPLESRINTGSAHRLAACIYIVQAIEPVGKLVGSEGAMALDRAMFDQLSKIPPEDPNFKATSWPTFIFGAGAKCPERQSWVMERLHRLVLTCPWGFIYTAMETLQIIWNLHSSEMGGRSWVQTLKDPALNFLIV